MQGQANVMRLAWRSPHDPRRGGPIAVGDLVRTGENLHPHYEVIATSGDRAWVRDAQYGTDHVVPITRCARI
jgi:hypothetical protein